LSLITGAIATILLCNYLRRNRHEKIVVGHAALGQLSARARKQSQQPEPEQLEDFERRHNGTGLRRQIYWRLHTDEAGPRYDLSTSSYWQNKTKPLLGTTSGSDRKGITIAENELQLISKGGSGLGSFNHHLDQDHREGMLRPIANLAWPNRPEGLPPGIEEARYVGWLAKKTHSQEVRRNFIAPGCPINDVLDFGGHFLSLGWSGFFKRGSFSTATPYYTQNPHNRIPSVSDT
jgi:hypothetical protein